MAPAIGCLALHTAIDGVPAEIYCAALPTFGTFVLDTETRAEFPGPMLNTEAIDTVLIFQAVPCKSALNRDVVEASHALSVDACAHWVTCTIHGAAVTGLPPATVAGAVAATFPAVLGARAAGLEVLAQTVAAFDITGPLCSTGLVCTTGPTGSFAAVVTAVLVFTGWDAWRVR